MTISGGSTVAVDFAGGGADWAPGALSLGASSHAASNMPTAHATTPNLRLEPGIVILPLQY
jgi:hypothetical protein